MQQIRNYRFRVMAANNDGVWNEAGASFNFSVAPAYYQTTWFAALVVAAVLAFFTGLHRLRLLYVTQQFNARLEGARQRAHPRRAGFARHPVAEFSRSVIEVVHG